jgi:hypothetical protein
MLLTFLTSYMDNAQAEDEKYQAGLKKTCPVQKIKVQPNLVDPIFTGFTRYQSGQDNSQTEKERLKRNNASSTDNLKAIWTRAHSVRAHWVGCATFHLADARLRMLAQ